MDGDFRFDSDPMVAALDDVKRRGAHVATNVLAKFAFLITGTAKKTGRVPIGPTGNLQRSHTQERVDDSTWRVGATASYAAVVHAVHPRKAKWFLRTIIQDGPRAMKRLLNRELREEFS